MIKRILILCTLLFTLSSLFACRIGGGDGGGNVDGGNSVGNTVIYGPDNILNVVMTMQDHSYEYTTGLGEINRHLTSLGAAGARVTDDSFDEKDNELVLGSTSRPLTAAARDELNKRLRKELRKADGTELSDDDLIGFTVYSNGKSVAVYWNSDYLKEEAIRYFYESYLDSDSLTLPEGYSKTVIYNELEYVRARDAERIGAAWDRLSEAIGDEGKETVNALQRLYSIYTDDMVVWLANLYDPAIGGWYHSNSARDNLGYLPDVESTHGALGFISLSGMADDYGGNYAAALPGWIKEQIGLWVQGLQDEDGFFYHPQWGKDITVSRKNRDLGSSVSILRELGFELRYENPNSRAASFEKPLSSGGSAATAVSAVIAAADPLANAPEWFKSVAAYKEYIYSFDMKEDSYSVGNTLQSQVGQIRYYSGILNADLMGMTIQMLNETQNRETGVWYHEATYYATNGLHKIAYFYNAADAELPLAEKAINTTFTVINSEAPLSAGVDIYNAWSCFGYIIENIRSHSTGTLEVREERAQAIISEVRSVAPYAIDSTLERVGKLRKDDGSFSYGAEYSSSTDQGAPSAVPYTVEGDVNGNNIASIDVIIYIMEALDLAEYQVPLFTESDRLVFVGILEELGGVIKNVTSSPEVLTFEEDEVGFPPVSINFSPENHTSPEIVALEGDPKNTRALKVSTPGGYYFRLVDNTLKGGKNRIVFETDICFESFPNSYIVQIMMGQAACVTLRASSDKVYIYDSSSTQEVYSVNTNLGAYMEKGKWHTFRAEYYIGDAETVRNIYYLDGEIIGITDNYYGKPKSGTPTAPKLEANYLQFYVMSGKAIDVLFDNMFFAMDTATYTPMVLEDPDVYNVDAPPPESITYDFEDREVGGDLPKRFSVSERQGILTVAEEDGNKFLNIIAKPRVLDSDRNPTLTLRTNVLEEGATATVLEMDMNLRRANNGTINQIYIYGDSAAPIMEFNIVTEKSGDGQSITLTDFAKNPFSATLKVGERFHLRIEYYCESQAARVFINGEFAGTTRSHYSEASRGLVATQIVMGAVSSADADIFIDNIKLENIVAVMPPDPVKESIVYDFEDGTVHKDITVNEGVEGGSVSVKQDADGYYLEYAVKNGLVSPQANPSLTIPANLMTPDATASVLSLTAKITLPELPSDSISSVQFVFYGVDGLVMQLNVGVSKTGGIIIRNSAGGTYQPIGVKVGEKFTLRFEYFHGLGDNGDEGELRLYVNGGSDPVFITSDKYSSSYKHSRLTRVSVVSARSGNGNSVTALDNINFENVLLEYQEVEAVPPVEEPEGGGTDPTPDPDPNPDPDPTPDPDPNPDPDPDPDPNPDPDNPEEEDPIAPPATVDPSLPPLEVEPDYDGDGEAEGNLDGEGWTGKS